MRALNIAARILAPVALAIEGVNLWRGEGAWWLFGIWAFVVLHQLADAIWD